MTDKPVKLVVPLPPAPPLPAPPLGARELFEFLSKHVVLISALVAVLAVGAATAGLYAYLSVFDWRLIWVIEYPDVLKWGLVTIAIISGFAFIMWAAIIDNAIGWVTRSQWRNLKIAIAISVAIYTAILALDYFSSGPHHTTLIGAIFFALAMVTMTAISIVLTARCYPNIQMRHVIADVFFIIFAAGAIGTAIGNVVQDSDGFKHHVSTRTGVEFRSVGLVMMTSRYVVLWDRDHAVVLPAEDVTKIEGQPRPGNNK